MLKNKKIVVFGSGGLLGAHVVDAVLKQGASVIATDINVSSMENQFAKLEIETFDRLELCHLDVVNEVNVKAFFKRHNHISGAVNCTYPRGKDYGKHFFNVSLESFNENICLLLGSAFLIMQQCGKYFTEHGGEFSLVNISSVYGITAPRFDIYNGTEMTTPVEYAAAKSSLIHLNKYVSKYVSHSGFRVNSVSPGGIYDFQPESFCESYRAYSAGTGMLKAQDMVGAVCFLLSDSSKYLTGQNLTVDDGFSL